MVNQPSNINATALNMAMELLLRNAHRFRIVFLDSDLSFDGGLLIMYNGSRTECLLSTEYSYDRHCKLGVKVTYVKPLRNISLAAKKSLLLTVSR